MNFYWRRVESQEKLQRRGNSVHNITLVGFRGQKVARKKKKVQSLLHAWKLGTVILDESV